MPKFYDWGGGGVRQTWSFGWLTGKDNDLICVKPDVQTRFGGEVSLSPVCTSRFLAICGFALKGILLKIDRNLESSES